MQQVVWAKLEELDRKATQGEWKWYQGINQRRVSVCEKKEDSEGWSTLLAKIENASDAELVVALRNTLPLMLEERRRMREVLLRVRDNPEHFTAFDKAIEMIEPLLS